MKLGIMGGTFDPIHNGHINMGLAALSGLGLDKVLFMPAGLPYFKSNDHGVTLGVHRYNMVWNAVKDYPGFEASDMELKRPGRTFTSDTLRELHKLYAGSELYFIMGADAFRQIFSWYEPEVIMELAQIVLFSRNSQTRETELSQAVTKAKTLYGARIHIIDWEGFDSSSTDIRYKLSQGHWNVPVPSPALAYIKLASLYKPDLTNQDIMNRINIELKPHRFRHSLGVAAAAWDLAKLYGADPEKAYRAGLLHDVGKPYGSALEHAAIGADIARNQYGIKDNDIIRAISLHTLGSLDMTILDEILYVADMIEPYRESFPGIEDIRKAAARDIKAAVALCAESTINYLDNQGKLIDDTTVKVYNKYKQFLQ